MLIGSLLAYIYKYNDKFKFNEYLLPTKKRIHLKNILSFLGIFLIIAGIFFCKSSSYPGFSALIPTIGTFFIISGGSDSWLNKNILSFNVMVFFGIISYPLYLWHWPLLSFGKIVLGENLHIYSRIFIILLSIIFAWLTYKIIEFPVRNYQFGNSKLMLLLVCMIIIGIIGFASFKNYLHPKFHNIKLEKLLKLGGWPPLPGERYIKEYQLDALGSNEKYKILLLGDSHAQQYQFTFARILNFFKLNKNIPEVMYPSNPIYFNFINLHKEAMPLIMDKSIKIVIFSYFWAIEYGSDKINYAIRCCGNAVGGSIGGNPYHPALSEQKMSQFDNYLKDTVIAFKRAGKKVYFILDNPFGEELAPRSLVERSFSHGIHINLIKLSKKNAILRDEPIRTRIINLAKKTGAIVIDPMKSLCKHNNCPALSSSGTPLYKDYDHLSSYGADQVHYLDFLIVRFNGK